MSWIASKRGGHARPHRPAAPGQPGAVPPGPRGALPPARQAFAPPAQRGGFPPAQQPPPGPGQRAYGPPARQAPRRPGGGSRRPPRHASVGPAGSGRRRPSPATVQTRRSRIAALVIVAVGVLVVGLATGFGSEPSAEPTAEAFLLAWQQQQYRAAGSLTTGPPGTVAADLRGVLPDLDATQLFLTMHSVVQHGATAEASFTATASLAESSHVWTYQGRFRLARSGGGWKVEWAPSVINPSLGPGERLAVVTRFPGRAPVLDADGHPLQVPAPVDVVGVWPDRLAHPQLTARRFAAATGLQAGQVLGQITAAPPRQFLTLASLDPGSYARMRAGLRQVPGLVVRRMRERLFQAEAAGLVGEVGDEASPVLRADGAFYLPGTTVGLSGLERAYQPQLLGRPATEVVVLNAAGAQAGVLARWPGTSGRPVRTTIDPDVQAAAQAALDGAPDSGEIVAVQASTGRVLAVAQRQASGALPAGGPLDARLMPGTAFTIVSAAALLRTGLTASTPISCEDSFTVGGQTFSSDGTGATRPFSAAFADDCRTAFAGLSERLDAGQFAQVARDFGIGADWSQLPVSAFSGSVPAASGDAALAAETIGEGSVRVSPLSMALVAAAVDSGAWSTPQFTADPGDPRHGEALDPAELSALRSLMRGAVRSGAARAAGLPGAAVYGQVGLVRAASGWMSWFVGFRGDIAFAVVETGATPRLSAAALARAFLAPLPG